jgi:uncharacterized membrane protein
MTGVLEVRKGPGEHSHWKVRGPAGSTLSWDAEVTERVPGKVLGWRSVPGAAVQHTGQVRLEPDGHGGTHVQVRLAYNPVAGAAGHAAAILLGASPSQQLDQDLLRMKTLVETGKRPHDAAARRS